ncbi:ureidoglycine aminohydrolase [Actinidia rufa]|uniref:Ureidoglycine aminohydrolase n=1 Tax=Actinidia rufa TaxID=165716 RepID=A0A7J0GX04_9ERIC|nr:ureidoglycine aminohydrolase [Actinidia rufa]
MPSWKIILLSKLLVQQTGNHFFKLPVFELRKLLPASMPYDFNIHVMDFQPGEFLNVKEVHHNQHGLLLLEGQGIYRLGDSWYPVQAGDAIWMAPFVPQWYVALGKTRSRYLLYKDVNRNPL